jgi:diguanylate cyclase (GGDEF)-like protein/PAS domain S-box-containing protein
LIPSRKGRSIDVSTVSQPSHDEAEALSRFVCDSVTEFAIFTTTSEGRIATWNPGAEHAFGYARSEVIGADFGIVFTSEDRAAGVPAAEMRIAIERGRLDRDCWHMRKDGSRFWGTNTVQPLIDGEGRRQGFTKIVRDSTERYEAAIALRQSEERFRLLVESVDHYAMFSIGPDGLITLWNSGAEQIFRYRHAEIIGAPFSKLFTPGDATRGLPEIELRRAGELGQVENERWQLRGDGSRFIARRRITLLKAGSLGVAQGFSVTAHDVTESRANEKTMRKQAFYDELTGLPNRALFVEHLQRTIAHTKRHAGSKFAVLFLDLDQFKTINDGFGHVLADQLLTQVGQRLRACVRPEDVVARIGGDEFTILVNSISSSKEVVGLTDRIHAAMELPICVETHEARATTSIGVALGSEAYERSEDILRDADIAMYEAKALGRANTVIFDDRMRASVMSRHAVESDLRLAVERNELFVEYQPIVGLEDLRVVGFEALVRWKHPTRGILQPVAFIQTAEQTGLIVQIDQWVLRTACAQLRTWQSEVGDGVPLTMSVNLSARQFSHNDLCQRVQRVLVDSDVAATSLNLEITESTMMERSDTVAAVLAELRALQVEIHIDDFGTGYSSLSYLRMLPVSTVKIDRSFISGMQTNKERAEMVRAIVALAHNLRLTVVAEGVEAVEELRALQDLSCEYAQGYLFARPLAVSAASALVASRVPLELPVALHPVAKPAPPRVAVKGSERRRTAGTSADRGSKSVRAGPQSA